MNNTRSLSQPISMYYIIIWFAYLALAPFYVFKSGYPQPADAIILLGAIPTLFLFLVKPNIKIPTTFLFGFLFVALTFLINVTHFAFLPDKKFFLSSLYYVYNFGIFLFVISLFKKSPHKINSITYIALALSIFIELLVVATGYGSDVRSQGSFNNPNQLSYWGLLSFALLIVIKRDKKINALDIVLISAIFLIQILSLSKAGIISTIFCFSILLCSQIVSNIHRIFVILFILIVSIYVTSFNSNAFKAVLNIDTIEAVYTRLSTIGTQGDDSLKGRGYTRIFDYPYYLILGAGEGGSWRYSPQSKELHSGLATLIFSYGIIGFTLFFTFLFFVFRGRPWRHALLIIPIMLYGLTHQNIRFTYFWVVIAAVYSGRYFDPKDEELLLNNRNIRKTPPR